ncbi:MAG: YhfC family glutamic-type intramembrane protease [Chloroflexota bacterium]
MDVFVRFLNPLLMMAIPLGLGVFLARRSGLAWRLFGIGCVTFIVSQVFHLLFNSWVLSPIIGQLDLPVGENGIQAAIVGLVFGLSAGVFEEVARYGVYRVWVKEARSWGKALMFGAGHGGVEAMILGGLAMYGLFQALALRDVSLSTHYSPEMAEQIRNQLRVYWDLPWYAVLLGAFERITAICFHLSAAVLVLQVFIRRNMIWLLLAIGWHTAINAMAYFVMQVWGMYIAEALLGITVFISLGIIFALRTPSPPPDVPQSTKLPEITIRPVEPTREKIEESRYV